MFVRLRKLFTRKPKQTTFCYCPKCDNELCSTGSYVEHLGDNSVHYKCSKCGTKTRWNFDAPVPLLLDTWDEYDGDWRKIPSNQWVCKWLDCDRGIGLAGMDRCPGDPRDADCTEFTTEYSDYQGPAQNGGGDSG